MVMRASKIVCDVKCKCNYYINIAKPFTHDLIHLITGLWEVVYLTEEGQ